MQGCATGGVQWPSHWRRVACVPAPAKMMPWVSSLFAGYKLNMSKSDHFQKKKPCKKAVTVKYAG
jgi:hypothetical protein